jgi:hypothetical protein
MPMMIMVVVSVTMSNGRAFHHHHGAGARITDPCRLWDLVLKDRIGWWDVTPTAWDRGLAGTSIEDRGVALWLTSPVVNCNQ